MLYKTNYLHSLFSQSYNTMAKSNNKTEQKLPGKAGRNSTKAEKKSPAKNDGTPAKQSCPQESETPTNNKTKKTLPPKKNETRTKHSPPQASEMPKNPYVPSPKSRNNGDKAKEIHKILKQMARHLVGHSLVFMISRNG
jgi:hypothetical protein